MLFDAIGFFLISFAFSIVVSLIRQEWEREIVLKQSKNMIENTMRSTAKRNQCKWIKGETEELYRNVYRIVLGLQCVQIALAEHRGETISRKEIFN